MVAAFGCREMQAYLASRPLPIHEFVGWARDWSPDDLLDRLVNPAAIASSSSREDALVGVSPTRPGAGIDHLSDAR